MEPIVSKISGAGVGEGLTSKSFGSREPQSNKLQGSDNNSPPSSSSSVEKSMDISTRNQKQQIADLQKVIDAIQGPRRVLEVAVHQETHAIMIKVLNEQTGEIIREIPPEKRLDVAAKMMELAGIIIDKKV